MNKIELENILDVLEEGKTIEVGMLACKFALNNAWGITPCWITVNSVDELVKYSNEYMYYNCSKETGEKITYYLK